MTTDATTATRSVRIARTTTYDHPLRVRSMSGGPGLITAVVEERHPVGSRRKKALYGKGIRVSVDTPNLTHADALARSACEKWIEHHEAELTTWYTDEYGSWRQIDPETGGESYVRRVFRRRQHASRADAELYLSRLAHWPIQVEMAEVIADRAFRVHRMVRR